jgi:hypothetical protein
MPKKSATGAGKATKVEKAPWGLEQIRVGSCPPNQSDCACGTVTFELTSAGGTPTIYSWNCINGCVAPGDRFDPEDFRAFDMDSYCLYTLCCVPPVSAGP